MREGRTAARAVLALVAAVTSATIPAQAAIVAGELLGRPTASSVTLNVVTDAPVEAYVEYGTAPGAWSSTTPATTWTGSEPVEIVVDGLAADTRYWYRFRHRDPGAPSFESGDEHTFHTQRAAGQPFTFAIQADSHLDANTSPAVYERTLDNVAADAPDFFVDLGDTFMSEKFATSYPDVLDLHLRQRPYFGRVTHSAPLMLVLGNHEGELGWLFDGTADNMAAWATQARTLLYPNPAPDAFYSGDERVLPVVGRREAFYAWTWGDALFVVLDPFWDTTTKPGQSGDNWDWTLGRAQYDWLAATLESTPAKYRFVFLHHLVGGTNTEGRGGIAAAPYYEWGGLDADGSWGFDANRPGWPKPIHQLLVEHGVDVVFHGHDHLFVTEQLDGIVYQEVPQPSHPSINATNAAAGYGYTTGTILSSSGHLRVEVSPTEATVDYVRAYLPVNENETRHNGDVAHSYTLDPDTDGDGVGDALDDCTLLDADDPPSFPPDQNPKGFRLTLRHLEAAPGAQEILAKAWFAPARTTPEIDPAANGVRVVLEDGAGVLWTVDVPGGASACGADDGWRKVESATVVRWSYRNASGDLPDGSGGCTAGAARGLRGLTVTRKTGSRGIAYRFRMATEGTVLDAGVEAPLTRLRFALVLGAGPATGQASQQAMAGQCAEFLLAGQPVPAAAPKPYCKAVPPAGAPSTLRCIGI